MYDDVDRAAVVSAVSKQTCFTSLSQESKSQDAGGSQEPAIVMMVFLFRVWRWYRKLRFGNDKVACDFRAGHASKQDVNATTQH